MMRSLSSGPASTQPRHRGIALRANRQFFSVIIAAGAVLSMFSAAFSQQKTSKAPPPTAQQPDKPKTKPVPTPRRESLGDLPELSDSIIELAVEDELLRSAAVNVVTLTGEVSHLTAKLAAERDARQTIGVRRVKNNLRTRWPDKPPTDEQIADFTRQALARDPYVEKHNIVVECENAHASLYGYVDTEFEKEHAVWTASCQKGVVHMRGGKTTSRSERSTATESNTRSRSDRQAASVCRFVDVRDHLTRT